MKLHFSRTEKKGLFGKRSYISLAQLDATEEERQALKEHQLDQEVLFEASREWGTEYIFRIHTYHLLRDKPCDTPAPSLQHIIILENRLKTACARINQLIKDSGYTERTIDLDE